MAPNGIAKRIHHLAHASETGVSTLRIVPFTGSSATEPRYCVLDEHTVSKVIVTEIGEHGTVPMLLVSNPLDVHLLLIADQELVGAKQNRVLDSDVFVPPGAEVKIPVSCVERGRWGYGAKMRHRFKPAGLSPSFLRAKKSSEVLRSLTTKGTHRSDQMGTWEELRLTARSMAVESPTGAMRDIYETLEEDLSRLRRGIELPDETVGVAMYDGNRFLGMDVFDRASTFQTFWTALVNSYALDVLIRRRAGRVEVTSPESAGPDLDRMLDELCAGEWTRHDSPGDGDDYRLRHGELTGSCLIWGEQCVLHIQVFPARGSSKPTSLR